MGVAVAQSIVLYDNTESLGLWDFGDKRAGQKARIRKFIAHSGESQRKLKPFAV